MGLLARGHHLTSIILPHPHKTLTVPPGEVVPLALGTTSLLPLQHGKTLCGIAKSLLLLGQTLTSPNHRLWNRRHRKEGHCPPQND